MRRRERGEGQLGCVFGIVLFLAALFVAYRFVPMKTNAADLRETMIAESRNAGSRTDKQIRAAIMAKARELDLPLKDTDLKIRRGNNQIKIEYSFVAPIEFPGYVHQYRGHAEADNPIF